MKHKSQIFAGIVAVLSLVIAFRPYYVLYVPKVGWLLHLALGGSFPPFMDPLDSGIFERCKIPEECPWLSPGDVIVDVCGKCGTNWLMTIVHELRTWDQPELRSFKDVHGPIPWPEQQMFPGDDVKHRHEHWGQEWNNSQFLFKMYKSHFPVYGEKRGARFEILPIKERPDVKFIFMSRNPADQMVSMQHFIKTLTPEARSFWGGLPVMDLSLEACIDMFFDELSQSPAWFFKTSKEYEKYPNVLILHYTDVFKDPAKYVKKIAKFLSIDGITEEAFQRILKETSVKEMKKRDDQYRGRFGKNRDIPIVASGAIVRKGGSTADEEMSKDLREKIHNLSLKVLSPEDVQVLEFGFDSNQ